MTSETKTRPLSREQVEEMIRVALDLVHTREARAAAIYTSQAPIGTMLADIPEYVAAVAADDAATEAFYSYVYGLEAR